MPPQKDLEDGLATVHATFGPLSTPLSFVSSDTVCCVVGTNVCLWNINTGERDFIYTTAYSIVKLCGNLAQGMVAFCEGGASPQVFVYSVATKKQLFALSGVTELELADMAFSSCGSRLYTLSRATSKRLQVFSTKTGKLLPGCELSLPQRFDKLAVFPGHKDSVALVRSSSVRIVSIQKSYETYIMRLLPPSLPLETDLSVSAFAWARARRFLFATRQGALVTLDGLTGALLHAVQAEQPITSIAESEHFVITSHVGNIVKLWSYSPEELPPGEEGAAMLQAMPSMEGGFDTSAGVFVLQRVVDLDGVGLNQPSEERLMGQVAYMQVTPDLATVVLTTAEGEVWSFPTPGPRTEPEGDEPAQELEVPDLQLTLLSWFHTHPVSDALILDRSTRTCASCDESGRLRIWQLTRAGDAKGFRTLSFSSALSSICADEDGVGMLLAGTDSGCVHLISCPGWKTASVVDSLRVSDSGVARLCSVTQERSFMWVAAALFDNRIALMMIPFNDPRIVMMGFIDLRGSIEDICFGAEEFEGDGVRLAVAGVTNDLAYPCLWAVGMPSPEYEAVVEEIPRDVCPVWCSKLSTSQMLEERPTAVAVASSETVVVGFAGGTVKLYPMPVQAGAPNAKMPTTPCTEVLPKHDEYITRLRVCADGKLLVSASMDGSVRKIFLDENARADMPMMQKYFHNPYNGGVAQVFANTTCDFFLSTGGSDGLVVWSDPRAGSETPAPHPLELEPAQPRDDPVVNVDDKNQSEFPVWKPVSVEEREQGLEANDDPELTALALAQRRALTLEVDNLRKKLRLLIEQNAAAPDLERLDRNEFCVDLEERKELAAKAKERCDALRAQIERDNVARQLIRDRLIKEFWDPMSGKGCQIVSLSSKLSVSNYPERIVSQQEQVRLKKLRLLRQAEQMETEFLNGSACPTALKGDQLLKSDAFASGEETYVVNWWHKGVLQKGASPDSVQKFLFEPFELLTNARRRLQVHLLQALAAEYRVAFNGLFTACQSDKKSIMDQIKEKVHRMRSILGELQIKEEVPEPELDDMEHATAVLEVKAKEIKAAKWVSPEEQRVIDEARRKEEERLRQLRENDAGQRALNQMMGGTLKTKKDLSALEITLDKELWMDEIPEEEMTEVQLAALQEFRAKEKALAEEQEKYRKQLDAEFKRLKSEVQDLTQQFEMVLKELHHKRFTHDAKFFCQELYCVRLQLALLQSVEDGHVLRQSTEEVESAKRKLVDAEATLEAFGAKVAAKKAKQDERIKLEKEAASAANFRQQFANSGLEPDAVATLLQLFRKKAAGRRLSAAGTPGPLATDQAAVVQAAMPGEDPYADLGTAGSQGLIVDPKDDDDAALECPEGVDQDNFQRMLDLRRERSLAEIEVQKGAAELQEMTNLLAFLQGERDEAERLCQQLQSELVDHVDLMKREEYDVEMLFKLKQGQVEVPQAAVVTDYSDAVVIDSEVVESRNRRILELGKEKVGTLETIKEFRKKLGLIQWEYKMLQMQTSDLEERTKDVHMLRVTKGLQSLLKGGEEGRNKADADLLERKIDHLSNTIAQKEAAMKKQYAAASHATKLRKAENAMLEKKLRELQQNVMQREHIRRLRAPQGGAPQGAAHDGEKPRVIGGGGRIEENEGAVRAAQGRFREVKTRQSLMEAAKKHTEEIEILSKELDRLRQKTFPSFVQLSEDRGNPDHR